jgi:hypothetical protein
LIARLIGKVFETCCTLSLSAYALAIPVLKAEYTAPCASKFWVAHTIVQTLASACLPLEFRWHKGRQADKMRT